MRVSKSPSVLLILLKTGSLDSALGESGDGVLGARSSEIGLIIPPGGLGLCLVARSPKSWPKLNGVVGGLLPQSSLKKLAIEFVGD